MRKVALNFLAWVSRQVMMLILMEVVSTERTHLV